MRRGLDESRARFAAACAANPALRRVLFKTAWHLARHGMTARGWDAQRQQRCLSAAMLVCTPRAAHVLGSALVVEGAGCVTGADDVCAVCLEAHGDGGSSTRLVACGHRFHTPCVCAWFCARPGLSCPVCRRGVDGAAAAVHA